MRAMGVPSGGQRSAFVPSALEVSLYTAHGLNLGFCHPERM